VKKMFLFKNRKGQSIVEYAILLGVVIAALLIMQVFVKRGFQGGLKDSADRMGDQFSASNTTIKTTRGMSGGNQTIVEETNTNATIAQFVGDTLVSGDKGTRDANAYSYSSRTGGNQTATTETLTDTAKAEKFKVVEYANTTQKDFDLTGAQP
jgi:Flp pilus assembly pilin Flp